MAASSLAEDLLNPICLAIFQEPHMLSCGHNFCLACLKGCFPDGGGGPPAAPPCPECQQPFKLAELASNRALGSLARKVRRLRLDLREGNATADALRLAPPEPPFCQEHDEQLKLFCKHDRHPVCVICRNLPEHRGHDFLPTRNAVEYAQKKLKPYLKSLKKNLKDIVDDEAYQQKEIATLESCTEDTMIYIAKEFEVLHQILHDKEEYIKKLFQEMKEDNLKEMQDSLTSLKDDVSSHTKLIVRIREALVTTDHVGFLKDFKDLVDKIEECNLKWVKDGSRDEEAGSTSNDEENDTSERDPSDEGEKSGQEKPCDNSGSPKFDLEEDENWSEEEYKEEEEEEEEGRVVVVELALEEFVASLDFEAWSKMLKGIKPR